MKRVWTIRTVSKQVFTMIMMNDDEDPIHCARCIWPDCEVY